MRIYVWSPVPERGGWILRRVDSDYFPGDFCLHAILDSGRDRGDVVDAVSLFFPPRVPTGKAVAVGLLGIRSYSGAECPDQKSDWSGLPRDDYFCLFPAGWKLQDTSCHATMGQHS